MYLQTLMQAEREFTKLAQTKDQRSKDKSLPHCQRMRNQWDHVKCIAERDSYRREIEEIAEDSFPPHLELEIYDIINTQPL